LKKDRVRKVVREQNLFRKNLKLLRSRDQGNRRREKDLKWNLCITSLKSFKACRCNIRTYREWST